jgi:hypothetical protein
MQKAVYPREEELVMTTGKSDRFFLGITHQD